MYPNQEEVDAVCESIWNWKDALEWERLSNPGRVCPLCNMFIHNVIHDRDLFGHLGCPACPVGRMTGQIQCHNTPFYRDIDTIQQSQDRKRAMVQFGEKLLTFVLLEWTPDEIVNSLEEIYVEEFA